jgi:hypothetical protein
MASVGSQRCAAEAAESRAARSGSSLIAATAASQPQSVGDEGARDHLHAERGLLAECDRGGCTVTGQERG